MENRVYVFADGGYLRKHAGQQDLPWVDPWELAVHLLKESRRLEGWRGGQLHLARVTYYDGHPDSDEEVAQDLREYWEAVERRPDTGLGFGMVRGKKPPRQKGVDTLMAVDMLVGAFTSIYDVAL